MASNWAICIGVSKYKFHRDLKYAHRDAEELGKLLKEKANFEKVYTFTEDSPPIEDISPDFSSNPERSNILEFLHRKFPNKQRKKPFSLLDNLWVFFAGHGWEYKGDHYLLPSDTIGNPQALHDSAISVEDLTDHLRRYSGAGNIIMLIDACRESGERSIGYFKKQQGVITISSCESGQFSYEIDKLKHGSFTYALLESLSGLAEDNYATVGRLCRRLRSRVGELNLKYEKPVQTPYTVIEPDSKLNLILLPDYIRPTDADIALLEREAFKAEAEADYETAEIMWQNLVQFNQDEALRTLRRIWEKSRISPPPPPPPKPIPERDVDYTKLRELLAAGKWREADNETFKLMLKKVNRPHWLNFESLKRFPASELKKINEYWLYHSDGKFGFSVQRRIWLEQIGTKVSKKAEELLAKKLGWYKNKKWQGYGSLNFSINAPDGHLPARWGWQGFEVARVQNLTLKEKFSLKEIKNQKDLAEWHLKEGMLALISREDF